MKNKPNIGIIETMFTMLLFLIGSAIIVGMNLTAEKSSWMVNLFAGSIGLLLFHMYVYIWRNNDFKSLGYIFNKRLGKHLGSLVSLVYVLYFAYLASRVLTDFTFFINSTLLFTMHPFFIKSSIFLIVVYTYMKGLEAFIRSAVIMGTITLLFLLLLPIVIMLSGSFRWEYVDPILSFHFEKIVSLLPTIMTFPYGELLAFLLIFPFLNRTDITGVSKKGTIMIIFFIILLSLFSFLIIGILHPELAKNYTFPLITAIERVKLFDFIERLDTLAVIIFIIAGYFKITVFTFASINLAKHTMSRVNPKFLAFLILTINYLLSYTYSDNISQHLQVGLNVIPAMIHLPLLILLPALVLIITFIGRKRRKA